MSSFCPDDYFESCTDHLYKQLTQDGKGRMAIERAFRLLLVEVLEEVHHRVSDVRYEQPSVMLDDLVKDIDDAIQYYE